MDPNRLKEVLDMADGELFSPDMFADQQHSEMLLPALPEPTIEKVSDDADLEADFDMARSTSYQILQAGKDALAGALKLASDSQSPRAYETLAGLMKTVQDVNTSLLDLHDKKRKMKAPEEQAPATVTNNNVFVGSTAELLLELRAAKMKTIEEIE